MRILHVTHQYPPDRRGGVEVYTQTLADYQAARGHRVTVLHGWADKVNEPPLIGNRGQGTGDREIGETQHAARSTQHAAPALLATQPRAPRHPLELFVRSFHNPPMDRAFAGLLREFQPDVVHVQHLKGLSARLVQVAQAQDIPVVWTLHDWWAFCGNAQLVRHTGKLCGGPQLWLNCADCAAHQAGGSPLQTGVALAASPIVAGLFAYRARLLTTALHAANILIAPSALVRDRFAQQGLDTGRIQVVEHGIEGKGDRETGRQKGRKGAAEIRNTEYGTRNTKHAPRIAYLGGLAWQKGVHVLVEAFNTLPPDRATLTIYGDPRPFPQYVAQLRTLARHPRIIFAGPYVPADRWRILVDVDLVVVPSVWPETSNLVAQEAQTAGIPVIASAVGALQERVRDGVDGRLFPPGDVAALARILHELTSDPAALPRLRAGVRPPRTLADHAAELEAIYEGL